MRNLAIKLVLWLCARFDIVPLDEMRRHASPDAKVRGERWHAFYHEEGGLADMLAEVRREAFEAASELDPSETEKIYYWAMSDRNVRRLENKVRSVIANGRIAAKQEELRGAVDRGNPRKSV